MKITLNGKEYTIKFGYKAVVESKIIQKLVTLETGNTTELEAVDKILGFLPEFLLVGLQKFHKDEFGFDNEGEKKDQLDKVFDLLDDYFEDENGGDFKDLYQGLSKELEDNSFLSKLLKQEVQTQSKKPPKAK